ncbi:MAG: response regulator [Gammaproteobacteria bacterium]|nr:MAG: response regulator [Gammaproteobacteria bacterium]
MGSRLKVFVIDDSPDYRALLGHHVTSHWPDAEVTEYDPLRSGRLPPSFSGAGQDLVLLGHPAGGDDALEWLRQFRAVPRFPPVIMIGDGEERQIVAAMQAGAAEYLSKQRLNHQRLVELIEQVLDAGRPKRDLAAAGLPSLRGYQIVEQLSVSDVSPVYLTREAGSGRPVVLKLLRQTPDSGSEVAFDRFLREYELIAALDHPSIVRIYDLGVADDHAYIAMEYCGQGSLKRRITAGMNPERAYSYMRQIAAALGALHAVGIMHRDLKPTNVMFRDDGSLVLIDFGLARQAKMCAEITGTGEIFGTPYYMSPEQGHGASVDERGDIYALGVIFYEMLTGRKPFDAATPMAMIVRHRRAPIPRLPGDLARYQPAIDRMMAKDPADRFQSVDELLDWQPVAESSSAAQA